MSGVKEKQYTDFQIVQKQFLHFRTLEKDIDIINIVNNYNEQLNEIGETTEHIQYNSYKEIFDIILYQDQYTIALIDDSMILMHYIFDNDGNMIQHTLSFLPNYKDTYLKEDELWIDDSTSEINYNSRLGNYIRVDYNSLGRREYYHTLVHMHVGVFKDGIRIPLQHFLYPYEFLYIIFKYIYHIEDDKLKKLFCDLPKECKLQGCEMDKLRIIFGKNE